MTCLHGKQIPQEPVEPLGTKRKRAKSVKRQKSESKALEEVVLNPEEGWDDDTEPTGVVIDYVTKEEVSRRVLHLLAFIVDTSFD